MLGKKVSDSEVIMLHPLEQNEANAWGNIHGGNLLRHIDNAGGIVAMRHARATVVTASIDTMDFLCPLRPGECITLKGSMHLVGRSSMDVGVRVEVESPLTGIVRHAATCYLTYVALDGRGRPIEVPPLIIEGELEQRRYDDALKRREQRLKRREEKKTEAEDSAA
jgi:acyl-CoA hydrolase